MDRLRAYRRLIHRWLCDAHDMGLSHRARHRLHWFAFALDHGCGVSETCRHFGIARSTFLKWARRFDPRDPCSLEERSRRPRCVRRPKTQERLVILIQRYRQEHPTMGKEPLRELLAREHDIRVSASTVGRIVERNGFYFAETPAHRRKRRACKREQSEAMDMNPTEGQLSFFDLGFET